MALTATHPGEHLAEELEALDMSTAQLARKINVPTNRIAQILNGTRAIRRHCRAPRSFLWHERSVLAESTEPLRPAARPGEGRKIHQGTSRAKRSELVHA
jgi:transcriptional regulator with XRE-family HTH domain